MLIYYYSEKTWQSVQEEENQTSDVCFGCCKRQYCIIISIYCRLDEGKPPLAAESDPGKLPGYFPGISKQDAFVSNL